MVCGNKNIKKIILDNIIMSLFSFNLTSSDKKVGSDTIKGVDEVVAPLFSDSDKNVLFGTAQVQAEDTKKYYLPSAGAAPIDSFLADVNRMKTNTFQNNIDRKLHNREVFALSIEKPVEFIKSKNALYKQIKKISENMYKQIINMLVSAKMAPTRAENIGSQLGSQVFGLLEKFLNEEVLPSSLEDQVMKRRTDIAKTKLTGGLGEIQKKALK